MNMKIVIEPLRNFAETLSTQNMTTLRNFEYLPKFLVSYEKMTLLRNGVP